MTHFRTIEIDFEVHKMIENERRGFEESPNGALRRLLSLPGTDASKTRITAATPHTMRDWSDQGVVLPHGSTIRMEYNRRIYEGEIVDGEWVIDGRKFASPSGAASGVGLTKKGKTTRLDGWNLWYAKLPGEDHWTLLDRLRLKPTTVSAVNLNLEDDLGLA